MKILLIGNHTCANRGDCAILRGLINAIQREVPSVALTIISRFPEVASLLLNREVLPDLTFEQRRPKTSIWNRVINRIGLELLYYKLKYPVIFSVIPIYKSNNAYRKFQSSFDLIIQVGGSFFNDLYGIGQYENLLLALIANKRTVLAGHSIGPFQSKSFLRFSRVILPKVDSIILRERKSYNMMSAAGIDLNNVSIGADTAWLLNSNLASLKENDLVEIKDLKSKIVAVTVRDIGLFSKRLGMSQVNYEKKMKGLLDKLIGHGLHIIGISMCTGLGSYNRDDRFVAERIRKQLNNPEMMTVLWNEYTDLQIGNIIQQCEFLIGTRLHSVIISLLFNTPAIGIEYEHKFRGVFKNLGLEDFLFDVQMIDSEEMHDKIREIMNDKNKNKDKIDRAVRGEISRANKGIEIIKEFC